MWKNKYQIHIFLTDILFTFQLAVSKTPFKGLDGGKCWAIIIVEVRSIQKHAHTHVHTMNSTLGLR